MQDQKERYTLHSIIKNAAELLLKCAGYLDDVDAAQRGVNRYETYYAIDTDIVTLYLEPKLKAQYMDIFGEEKTSVNVISLALMLGEFLVASDEPLIPGQENRKYRFLLIPPHDEELLKVLTAIHRSVLHAASSVRQDTFDKLSRVFEEFERSESKDDISLKDALRDCAPDLVELYNPYIGPEAALIRYAQLPQTTFKRIDSYREENFTFPLLDPRNKIEDRKQADKLLRQWEARLERWTSSREEDQERLYAILTDAEVLATIEYVNNELRDKGRQVVLVTGSNYLFKAAGTYYPYSGDKRSFADLYLRHPQAFLSHENFFFLEHPTETSSENPQQSTFSLLKWLNLFFPSELFPPNQPQGRVKRNVLRDIRDGKTGSFNRIVRVIDRSNDDPQSINRLLDAWKTQVSSVVNRRYAGGLEAVQERGAEKLKESLKTLREKHQWTIDNLRKTIFDEALGSLSTLYSMTVWVGLWSRAIRQQPKGVPVLRFASSHKRIEDYCENVIQMQLESANKEVSQDRLEELYRLNKEVEQTDQSLYLSHVVHALAFAAKGDWYATWTLAGIALAIVDNMEPAQRSVRQGREAAYLACIARRRSARDQNDLDKATIYLRKAYEREDQGAKEDIRFKSEGLAIVTRRYFFSLFCERKSLDMQTVAATISALWQLVVAANGEENERVKRWVLRQTLTNYFSLLLIARDLKWSDILPSSDNIASELETFIKILKDDEEHGYKQKQDDDPYAYLIYNICASVWHSDPNKQQEPKKKALEAMKNWDNFVMPYDEERINLLKRSVPE